MEGKPRSVWSLKAAAKQCASSIDSERAIMMEESSAKEAERNALVNIIESLLAQAETKNGLASVDQTEVASLLLKHNRVCSTTLKGGGKRWLPLKEMMQELKAWRQELTNPPAARPNCSQSLKCVSIILMLSLQSYDQLRVIVEDEFTAAEEVGEQLDSFPGDEAPQCFDQTGKVVEPELMESNDWRTAVTTIKCASRILNIRHLTDELNIAEEIKWSRGLRQMTELQGFAAFHPRIALHLKDYLRAPHHDKSSTSRKYEQARFSGLLLAETPIVTPVILTPIATDIFQNHEAENFYFDKLLHDILGVRELQQPNWRLPILRPQEATEVTTANHPGALVALISTVRETTNRSLAINRWYARSVNNYDLFGQFSDWGDVIEDRFAEVFHHRLSSIHGARSTHPARNQRLQLDLCVRFLIDSEQQSFEFLIVERSDHNRDEVLAIMRSSLERAMKLAWRGKNDYEMLKYLKVFWPEFRAQPSNIVIQPIEEGDKFGAEYDVISFEIGTDQLLSALLFLDTVEYYVLCFLYLVSRPQTETTKVPKSFLYPPVRELELPSAIHGRVRGHNRDDANPRPTKLSKVQDSTKKLLNEAVDTYGVRNLLKQNEGYKGEMNGERVFVIVKKHCHEIQILSSLQHPNVVPLLGSLANSDRYCLILPELRLKPRNSPGGRIEVALRYLHDVLQGLKYLHSQGIFHGDVKPLNVLFSDQHRRWMLIDFGRAIHLDNEEKLCGSTGTRGFMAPEVENDKSYDFKADMWSLGMTLEVQFGPCRTTGSYLWHVFSSIMAWCMTTDPSKRPSATAAMKELVASQECRQVLEGNMRKKEGMRKRRFV